MNESPPICPNHGKPMRLGRGSYFCPTKVDERPDGTPIFCAYKVRSAPKPQAAAPRAASISGESSPVDHAAALSFAGNVFRGTGQGEDALALARLALEFIQLERLQGQ